MLSFSETIVGSTASYFAKLNVFPLVLTLSFEAVYFICESRRMAFARYRMIVSCSPTICHLLHVFYDPYKSNYWRGLLYSVSFLSKNYAITLMKVVLFKVF